jgi:nitroimidazol reductase NimA-like FMN-containing flavoprotein (pyridoxamine 5'-phosphate oxidase superfamily)
MPEKFVAPTLDALAALVRDARVGHFAFVEDGEPRVLPIAIVADGAHILLHGSTGSHWLRLIATGIPVALSVTAIDALVVARSAFESSMSYRSAVLFGSCAPVADDVPDKVVALDLVTEGLIPGRVAELRPHSAKELAATLVLRMTVDEWTLKVSDGWPEDGAADVAGPAWAGILPLRTGYTGAVPAPDLAPGIPEPDSVRRLLEGE